MGATLHIGDALTVLATLPAGSVDCVITSPPYLALRSYLPAGHADKNLEMGSEPTPAAFIDALLDVTEQLRRVLAPHGSICVELGDTYAGSGGAGGDYDADGLREGQPAFRANRVRYQPGAPTGNTSDATRILNMGGTGWPDAKSLCMIPESYRWALAYGHNPFNGRQTPRWRVRNVVRHFRPNPPVGALADKWRPATSDWVVACTGASRYFYLDSVRTEHKVDPARYTGNGYSKGNPEGIPGNEEMPGNPAGAPPLDWYEADDLQWSDGAGIVLPTAPFPGAHYATFSPRLISRFVECMTPRRVCVVCGKPSERWTETFKHYRHEAKVPKVRNDSRNDGGAGPFNYDEIRTTVGWSDCGHNAWRPGVVLDPFAGSGTTLAVATGHGYDAIGIDLDPRSVDLCRERVGMFLDVVEPVTTTNQSSINQGSIRQ